MGGFQCTVCPDTQYCMRCFHTDAEAEVDDGCGESVIDNDMDENLS